MGANNRTKDRGLIKVDHFYVIVLGIVMLLLAVYFLL